MILHAACATALGWRVRAWLVVLLVASISMLSGGVAVADATPVLAATPAFTYDASACTYDAPTLLSSQSAAASRVRGSPSGPDVASWGRSASTRACCTAADAASGAARGSGGWRGTFDSLARGDQSHVRAVSSEKDLGGVFDSMVEGAEQLPARGPKIPEVYRQSDGTVIQWRTASKSGGSTIDIFPPNSKGLKVHVQ